MTRATPFPFAVEFPHLPKPISIPIYPARPIITRLSYAPFPPVEPLRGLRRNRIIRTNGALDKGPPLYIILILLLLNVYIIYYLCIAPQHYQRENIVSTTIFIRRTVYYIRLRRMALYYILYNIRGVIYLF